MSDRCGQNGFIIFLTVELRRFMWLFIAAVDLLFALAVFNTRSYCEGDCGLVPLSALQGNVATGSPLTSSTFFPMSNGQNLILSCLITCNQRDLRYGLFTSSIHILTCSRNLNRDYCSFDI